MQTQSTVTRPLILLAVCGCSLAAHSQVVNSDFAARPPGEYDWPANWLAEKADRGKLYRLVDDDGHSGKDCLRYRSQELRPAGAVYQPIECKPNTQYTLTAWFKSDGALRPAVIVTLEADPGRELSRLVADPDTKWHRKTANLSTGAAQKLRVMVYGDVTIRATGQGPAGFSAIDDVQVAEKVATAEAAREAEWKPAHPNIALNKSYTLSRTPNYGLCADPGDTAQLTDGAYSVGYFWTQKSTVGWTAAETLPVAITIDLGQVEPIDGLSYHTAAGVAGVHWPRVIHIITSDDGKRWFRTGDLVGLDKSTHEPPAPDVYAEHRYATDSLATRGRYVALLVESDYYVFCDEIEVYRGTDPMPGHPKGRQIGPPLEFFWRGPRLERDFDTLAERLKKAKLSPKERQQAEQELESLQAEAGTAFPPLPKDKPAILPLNRVQARMFALNGLALKGQGLPALFAWKKSRYDPLNPMELPDRANRAATNAALTITMMNNEWRSDAMVLTNATPGPIKVRLRVTGLPGGDNPPYLSLRDVPFVDSGARTDIACALPEALREAKDYVITIPAGMNRQVWVMARPTNVAPGSYQGSLVVNELSQRLALKTPFLLRVSKVRFPDRPRMHVGGWDYTNGESCYDVVPTNRDVLVEYLKEHYVDSPWGTGSVLPGAGPGDFDAAGRLTKDLSFSPLDDWVKRWEGARVFLTFVNAQAEFAGAKMDNPQFAPRVASWISAIAAHVKTLGLRPEQFGLLIWDEPNSDEHARVIIGWADAIHQAGTGIRVWEDPQYWEPQSEVLHESLTASDIVSPFVPLFLKLNEEKRKVYRDLASDQRKLWFYNASGPVRALDPYSYHRLQHWLCFREGAEGSCFWAFSDSGGGSSWNERASDRGVGYCPPFLSKDSVTDSKHMMALMEGVQDYEYLCLLRDRIAELEAKGVQSPALASAKELLKSAPQQVLADLDRDPDATMLWKTAKDRSLADRMCERVLRALEELSDKQ